MGPLSHSQKTPGGSPNTPLEEPPMALETGTYISDLVVTNPTGSDPLAFADDHLRLLKSTIKATFPNVTGAVTKTHAEINDGLEKSGGTMTGALVLSGAPTADLHAATKAYIDSNLAAAIATAVANSKTALYPVGSIYTNSSVATNPATLLGFGTWTAFGAGRVPVGFNAADPLFDTAEETGGSKDAVVVAHDHSFSGSTNSTGAHTHTVSTGGNDGGSVNAVGTSTSGGTLTTSSAGTHSHTVTGVVASTGSSGTNANLQPYITVYMWKRTA